MSTLLVRNARTIVTLDPAGTCLHDSSLYVEDSRIRAIGSEAANMPADVVVDASGHIVYPGLISTHHHLYQCLTRNVPRAQNARLFDWLKTLYQLWRGLQPEDVYLSAQVALGELLKSGCTTATDHFYTFPRSAPDDLLDWEIRAAQELGIRFHPTRGSMNRGESDGGLPPDDLTQSAEAILRDTRRVVETYHDPSPLAMLQIGVAPCSPFSVTGELMRESARLARAYGARLHTHLAEDRNEDEYCLQTYGQRPLAYAASCEWLGPDVWFAHGIHFDDQEIRLLSETRTGVCHCPTSNMKMAAGTCRVPDLRAAGVPLGLGTDGSASNDTSNMLLEARMALLLQTHAHGPTALSAEDALRLATLGGAALLGREAALGSLEIGKAADMFLVDASQLAFAGGLHDDVALPLLTGAGLPVATTIVHGKVVVSGGRLVGVDEERLADQAQAAADRLVNRC
ncbi:MAG: 8-oxoguanine deaminase [Chloroflexi bacterium]|nr:8-oxoguanine deaminase [Chloroflexota bacterium]